MRQSTLFVWIAAALGLVAALAALADRDTLTAVAWFGFAAAGALTASGATDRSRGLAYLAIALLSPPWRCWWASSSPTRRRRLVLELG